MKVSTGDFRVDGRGFRGAGVARAELNAIAPETLARAIEVSADGSPCPLRTSSTQPVENDGVEVLARWECPAPPRSLRIRLGFLELLPEGHLHVALLRGPGGTVQRSARVGAPVLELDAAAPPVWEGAARFLRLGAEHIFTGADHLAFLLGVLLLGGTFRQLLGIVTAFTLAHSVTLALATLGWVVPPPRLIEPLIALSIVAVALENLWALRPPRDGTRVRDSIRRRWRITLAFGLVHGFGFASALRALELPRSLLAPSLLTFNLGVELGQLAVVAVAWPFLRWLRGVRGVWPGGIRWTSAGLAALGSSGWCSGWCLRDELHIFRACQRGQLGCARRAFGGPHGQEGFVFQRHRCHPEARCTHLERGAVTENYGLDVKTAIALLNEAVATEIVCVLPLQVTRSWPRSLASEAVKENSPSMPRRRRPTSIGRRADQPAGSRPTSTPGIPGGAHVAVRRRREPESGHIPRESRFAERIAIEHYRDLVSWFGEKDSTTWTCWSGSSPREEEHANDMHDLLVAHEGRPMLKK